MKTTTVLRALASTLALAATTPFAAPVTWVDWVAATPGNEGSADGVLSLGSTTVDVHYSGQIAFAQISGGTNYYAPSAPYISALVDNAPGTPDIIALSTATPKTLTFSQAIDNLFFAVVSLNSNGYRFNQDFDIISYGTGYWGPGTMSKVDLGGGIFEVTGTGEPHGVIRFKGAVSSITWSSQTNEYWNGFTVGTYGLASAVPEPEAHAFLLAGLAALGGLARRRRGRD